MARDFSALMDVAIELGGYEGYLTTEELNERNKVLFRFNSLRNSFVYDELKSGEDPAAVKQSIADEVAEISAHEQVWGERLDFVRDELLARIDHESRKSPLARKVRHWLPVGVGVVCAIVYFSVRLWSGLDVSQPMASRAGIEQRAAAFDKSMRYGDWMEGAHGRGALVLGVLLWPVEPSDKELQAAKDMVGMSLAAVDRLTKQNEICPNWASDETGQLEQRRTLVSDIAAYVQSPATRWRDPPAMTLLDPIRRAFPCEDEVTVSARAKPKAGGAE